jgi:predicted transcriptional regulator
MMTSLNVPVIVVYDGRQLVGMLTDRDIGLNRRVQEAPQDAAISGFMRTSVPCCLEDDLLADAISVMHGSQSELVTGDESPRTAGRGSFRPRLFSLKSTPQRFGCQGS